MSTIKSFYFISYSQSTRTNDRQKLPPRLASSILILSWSFWRLPFFLHSIPRTTSHTQSLCLSHSLSFYFSSAAHQSEHHNTVVVATSTIHIFCFCALWLLRAWVGTAGKILEVLLCWSCIVGGCKWALCGSVGMCWLWSGTSRILSGEARLGVWI